MQRILKRLQQLETSEIPEIVDFLITRDIKKIIDGHLEFVQVPELHHIEAEVVEGDQLDVIVSKMCNTTRERSRGLAKLIMVFVSYDEMKNFLEYRKLDYDPSVSISIMGVKLIPCITDRIIGLCESRCATKPSDIVIYGKLNGRRN